MALKKKSPPKKISEERHISHCRICQHPRREEIEVEFLRWRSPAQIAKEFHLGSRQTVFRHARAFALFQKRAADIRSIFVAVIEQGMTPRMKVSAASVVAAAVALSKLDATGKTIERFERVGRYSEFLDDPRWTVGEMEAFARDGTLPRWYTEDRDTRVREMGPGEFLN